jgi:hypothetical protein
MTGIDMNGEYPTEEIFCDPWKVLDEESVVWPDER